MAEQIVKSTCGICTGGCGVLLTVDDGRVTGVRGDPDHPLSRGEICRVGLASVEYLYSPERLMYPQKRVDERGEGKWQRISWDEALDLVAAKLGGLKKQYGPETVAVLNGSAKGYQDTHLRRFANAFGTPNAGNSDYVCHVPRMLAAELTLGFFPGNDFSYPPASVVIWGTNKINSRIWAYKPWLKAAERGTKFAIVDPKRIDFAKKAEFVIQPRPGSDLALALALINVIINEKLYDKEFVEKWTVGFDRLVDHVQQYSPEKVAELTWVSAEDISKLAYFYAKNRPSSIAWGNGTDHNLNSFQTARALSILIALTGDIGVPGGSTEAAESGFLRQAKGSSPIGIHGYWSGELELRDRVSIEKWRTRVGAELGLVSDYRYVVPMAVMKAIAEGKPYPIRAAYVQATNPLSCWSNIKEAKRVLSELEFLVVSDLWMTPTAALADVVLPSASYMEFDGIVMPPLSPVACMQRKVAQVGECRSDHETLNELATRLGQEHFETADGFWEAVLKPIGLTFAEFKRIGVIAASRLQWRAYERRGFRTPSGKVEIYSSHLAEEGLDPLLVYRELPESPFSSLGLAEEYPLIFTNGKVGYYRDSSGRHLPNLRKSHPSPIIQMHPATAAKLGITEGDWVYVETKRGRIRNMASLTEDLDPRVVYVEHGWWLPEKGSEEMYGWDDCNINVLTDDKPPYSKEIGSVHLKGVLCKVYKA